MTLHGDAFLEKSSPARRGVPTRLHGLPKRSSRRGSLGDERTALFNIPMEIMVRDAVLSDAVVTAMLITELGYPASVDFATERLANFKADPFSRVQVAERDGEVVGLVATHVVPRLDTEIGSCRVVDIVVAPSQRRNGVGTALIRAAEAEARRQQCQRLDLSSGDWREAAHAFYEMLGFETQSRGFVKRLHCS